MRAMVLWTINDFPARSSLSGWSGQGYKACPTCNEETPSIGVKNKIAYVGHRRFLRKPHKWRSSREFNGDTDHRDPPKEYPRDVILAQHARLLTRVPGKHPETREEDKTQLKHNLDIMHIEKNVLEAILNTLLMNDKSKDTAKARQDLQNLGIRRPLWLTKNHKGKIVKPQAAYSFTPENRKKFCQYIKGVKLPDGFGSCFKHKVTDNDTNITGLKSHDCHIMMQRLLPYGLQNYLPDNIAKPIIELSSLFKQLCSATLMEDDMLKASVKICELHANNLQRPEVSTTSEFFSLANGPSRTPMSVNACVVDGVRYVVQSRDEPRTTQNSGICAPGPDGEMSYGQLQEILEFKYLSGVIVVENEPDIIHLDNSSDLPPSTSGNDLDNVTFYIDLHIDGESTEVDAPPDIIDVPGEDDDISDDEDPLPHDLADSDVEDLINDDDGVEKVYSSEEED
ncbi:zinc finger, PHD-type containing protein [Tanacetum coccineum]|uniref:Zinc finger, PHD-type containing protein n=1 Tax=Tanacetum coccineum TaxID=301880 RepID=A0ABQ5HSP9_9ASTR